MLKGTLTIPLIANDGARSQIVLPIPHVFTEEHEIRALINELEALLRAFFRSF